MLCHATQYKEIWRELLLIHLKYHIGIIGNEIADQLAKEANNLDTISQPIPLSIAEIKNGIRSYLLTCCQLIWDTSTTGTFYKQLAPRVSYDIQFSDPNRVLESTISRLRFNHNSLNSNKYRVNSCPTPLCTTCQTEEDINHYLFDCTNYIDLQ